MALKIKLGTVTVASASNPSKSYGVTLYGDGSWWCECPAFKFQRLAVELRTCKHVKHVLANKLMAPSVAARSGASRTERSSRT